MARFPRVRLDMSVHVCKLACIQAHTRMNDKYQVQTSFLSLSLARARVCMLLGVSV